MPGTIFLNDGTLSAPEDLFIFDNKIYIADAIVGEDGKVQTVIIRDDIEWEKLEWIHLRPTASTRVLDDKKMYRVFYVVRGSHTYDTKEFSTLLRGAVDEAKILGVETLDDIEIKRLVNSYMPPERRKHAT